MLKTLRYLFFSLILLEAFSFLALAAFQKTIYPVRTTREEMKQAAGQERAQSYRDEFMLEYLRGDVLHPYLGFVLDHPTAADPVGFRNKQNILPKKSPDAFNVLLLGGSVAAQTYDGGLKYLTVPLQKIPGNENRRIHIVRAALGGLKQPQQLMTLNFLLLMGGEYDLVINLDGFNEVALAESENIAKGVSPYFPRLWFERVGAYTYPGLYAAMRLAHASRSGRVGLAQAFDQGWLTYSAAWNLIWKSGDALLAWLRERSIQSVHEYQASPDSFEVTGPQFEGGREALYENLAETWARSSRMMHQLAQANGADYFHFLQPNQYVPDSRHFAPGEKEAFVKEGRYDYAEGVRAGYPLLKQKAREQLEEVRFFDLTQIFLDEPEVVYGDGCCHLNQHGYRLLAHAIGRQIRSTLTKEQKQKARTA